MQTFEQILTDVTPDRRIQISDELARERSAGSPWYLRFIMAAGAWLASLFFLGAEEVLFGWQPEHQTAIGATCIVMLIAAVIANRLNPFFLSSAPSLSLAGQGMIYYGFASGTKSALALAELSAALAIVPYVLYPTYLFRIITCLAALKWHCGGLGREIILPQPGFLLSGFFIWWV